MEQKIYNRSFSGLVGSWQIMLIVATALFIVLGVIWHIHANKIVAGPIGLNGVSQIKITSAPAQVLSPKTLTSDSPPSTAGPTTQAQGSNTGQASSSPIQNSTNINDPSVQNNALVQSLESGQ